MEKLIPIINQLHDVFLTIGREAEFSLPRIVVVGSESSGKSSVLESLVGKDFLPRGAGIVTRCPLILQLHHVARDDKSSFRNTGDGTEKLEEWGKFGHTKQIYSSFEDIRTEIASATERKIETKMGISRDPISLNIYSHRVANLTLVDLPGFIKLPLDDQPADIEKQTMGLIHHYIEDSNVLILAVIQANVSLSNAEALKLTRQVDKDGERTLVVLTKLDLMDAGTDARKVLTGNLTKLGVIGCVNRSQQDIINNKTFEAALNDEKAFFARKYADLAHRNGIPYLVQTLTKNLIRHIHDHIPDIKLDIDLKITNTELVLESCGEEIVDKTATLVCSVEKFVSAYRASIDGTSQGHLQAGKLSGDARIRAIFETSLRSSLGSVKALENLSDYQIEIALRNSGTGLDEPEFAFKTLIPNQLPYLLPQCMACLSLVKREMNDLLEELCTELSRFPNLSGHLQLEIKKLIDDSAKVTEKRITSLVLMQSDYINAKHSSFQEEIYGEEGREKRARKDNTAVAKWMIKHYFQIVRDNLHDNVPKVIMRYLVKNVINRLTMLPKAFNAAEKDIDFLLIESAENISKRKNAKIFLDALHRASGIIKDLVAE